MSPFCAVTSSAGSSLRSNTHSTPQSKRWSCKPIAASSRRDLLASTTLLGAGVALPFSPLSAQAGDEGAPMQARSAITTVELAPGLQISQVS